DHDLALLPAPWLGDPCSLDSAKLLDNEVLAVVEDLLFGQRVAGDGDLDNGHAGRAVADNVWRRDARRHDLQECLARGRYLGLGLGNLGPGLEVYADDADPIERLALDMFNIVDRGGQHALVDENDACLNLVSGHAGILPHHADNGDVDIWE